jgi:hypothetical protein
MRHALATGIPFAPEKDGTSFLSGQIGGAASRGPGPASRYPPQHGPGYPEPDGPPASGQDSWPDADPAGYPHRVLPPAGDADQVGHVETGPSGYSGGPAPDLPAVLARLAGEWLARRQRGR